MKHKPRWLHAWQQRTAGTNWLAVLAGLLLVLTALAGGYVLGYQARERHDLQPPAAPNSAP